MRSAACRREALPAPPLIIDSLSVERFDVLRLPDVGLFAGRTLAHFEAGISYPTLTALDQEVFAKRIAPSIFAAKFASA
jgi:hypothetical protein